MNFPLPPVLVVDDEKNMRRSLENVLSDEGYAARMAESAEEALGFLSREEFFMVITDARLGGMSGYELLKKIHEQKPELPVLMLTAYATPKLAVEAIKAGAIDYLSKPFAPEELLHAIARCAERYRLLRENAALRSRTDQVVHPRTNRRRIGKNARIAKIDPNRRANRRAGVDPGRERHGQGIGRGRAAQFEPAPKPELHPHQLRRHPRNPSGKRIVWPRTRRLHRGA